MAEVSLARYGEPVLLVNRFDRRWAGGRVQRLHLIDGCQMLDLPPTYKYERPFGKSGEAAKIRTGATLAGLFEACKYCRVPALASKNLLNWVLFQLLIGNNDAHAKNISFFVDQSGIDVAPAYDLVNVDLYGDEYDRDMAMAIGDTFSLPEIHAYQLAEMCEECALPQRQTATALKGICISLLKALDVFDPGAILIGDEISFAKKLMTHLRNNTARFLDLAKELPHLRL